MATTRVGRRADMLNTAANPEAGVDCARLERGLGLHAERVGPGRYHITGGAFPHWVDLRATNGPHCDCGDHIWRDTICKHMLAALLREGDEHVLHAVGELVTTLRIATLK